MARIAGINIPLQKHIVIALQSIYGVGRTRAIEICEAANVPQSTKVGDLSEPEVEALRTATSSIFQACGMSTADADLLGGSLVDADLHGVHSHGVMRIPDYAGRLSPPPRGERRSAVAGVRSVRGGRGHSTGVRALYSW